MKKLVMILMLGAVAGLVSAQNTMMMEEPQNEVEVTGDVGLYSAYVWRGQVLNDTAVIQPSLTVAKGPLSLNIWGNYDINGKAGNQDWAFHEVDFTLAYAVPMTSDDLSVDVGLIHYTFPNTAASDTDELFVTTVFNNIILTPTISVYVDVEAVNGWYGNLALSQCFSVSDALGFEVGASAGYGNNNYNDSYFGFNSDSGMNDYNAYVSAGYALAEDIELGALLQYTYLDGAMQNSGNYEQDDMLWGGLSVSYTF